MSSGKSSKLAFQHSQVHVGSEIAAKSLSLEWSNEEEAGDDNPRVVREAVLQTWELCVREIVFGLLPGPNVPAH